MVESEHRVLLCSSVYPNLCKIIVKGKLLQGMEKKIFIVAIRR